MTQNDVTAQWYVLRVVSGFECKIKDAIHEALQEDQNLASGVESVEAFSESKSMIKFGKRVNVESSAMPGYLMIKMRYSPELVSLIRKRQNVMGFLGAHGDMPEPVSESELEKLRGTIEKAFGVSSLVISVGESVKIIDGPFSGFSGVVDEVDDKKGRIKVGVAILGRRVPVDLEYNQVEKHSE